MWLRALALIALAAGTHYTEKVSVVPYKKNAAIAVFTFRFEEVVEEGLATNYHHFPSFLPSLLSSSNTHYFSLSLVQGQFDPSLWEIFSIYNTFAGTHYTPLETGLHVRSELGTDWEIFAAKASALVCSPLTAFQPIFVKGELYLHSHDFNCKENLINVIKLLPCRDSRGLGQLLTDSLYNLGYMHIRHSASWYSANYTYEVEVMAEVPATGAFRAKNSGNCVQSMVEYFGGEGNLVQKQFAEANVEEVTTAAISTTGQCVSLHSSRRFGGEMHGFEAWYQHTIENCFSDAVEVTVYEHFPVPLTPLLHSIILPSGTWTIEKAGKEGKGWLLTVCARIEPGQSLSFKLRVIKQMQQFENYPNDPQRGWDVPAMPIRYELRGTVREQISERLLIMVPEPDFSMPFNVMCVTGCIISFFFTTIQTFTLTKDPTHWSSPRYQAEVVQAEAAKTWARRIFLTVTLSTVYLLDRYGYVKLFG